MDGQKTPAPNSTYPKVAVWCSADTFVVNQSLVLRINIWGKNRHLRVAAKRNIWRQLVYGDRFTIIDYDKNIHDFIKEFVPSFEALKIKLFKFFDEKTIHQNVLDTIKSKQKLLS